MFGRAATVSIGLLALLATTASRAQSPDRASNAPSAGAAEPGRKLRFRESSLVFSQRVSTQTVGVGGDYLSDNPYYDWLFYFRPRFYFVDEERWSLSLRAQFLAAYELTNSDVTTRRNELTLEDTTLSLVPQYTLHADGAYRTELTPSLPRLVFPTSKAGFNTGKIVEVGVRAVLDQVFPLREDDQFLRGGHAGIRIGYAYLFTRAVVAERSDLDRLRTDLDGHVVTSDQVGGLPLAQHVGVLRGLLGADLYGDHLGFELEAGIDPGYRYALRDDVTIRNVETGEVTPGGVENPKRYGVATYFDASIEAHLAKGLFDVTLGYENITGQLGPDGRRRNPLWSPDAKFYLSFELFLDQAYGRVSGAPSEPSQVARREP